jgi:hypothetical protein
LHVYEQDPRQAATRPILIAPSSSLCMNILLHPHLDLVHFRKYKATLVDAKLTVRAFETEEEAEDAHSIACSFASTISVRAVVGAIGIWASVSKIDFGSVSRRAQETVMTVRNRSTHIPIDVVCSSSRGVEVEPSSFSLAGLKEQELTVRFTPPAFGINNADVQLVVRDPVLYTKSLDVIAFVDQQSIETNLPRSSKQIETLDLGSLYVVNGKPIPVTARIKLTNRAKRTLNLEMCNQRLTIPRERTTPIEFRFPYSPEFASVEESKFNHRILVRGFGNAQVIKVIDIVGEFVVSVGALSVDSISLGRFGRLNDWQFERKSIQISTKSNIELVMDVSSTSNLLALPDRVSGITQQSEYSLALAPRAENCEDEGDCVVPIVFTNRNNPANVLKCVVTFDIRHSFLQFDRVTKEAGVIQLFIRNFTRVGTTETDYTANSWFTVTNRLGDECAVGIETEELMPAVSLGIFMRRPEMRINSLFLQPDETAEVRVRATISQPPDTLFASPELCVFAKLHFTAENGHRMTVQVMTDVSPPPA